VFILYPYTVPYTVLYKLTLLFQKKALTYFQKVSRGSQTPPRVHPLLLSLSEAWCTSDISPDILAISEHDPRVFKSKYYVPPRELPPLGLHFSEDALPNTNGV